MAQHHKDDVRSTNNPSQDKPQSHSTSGSQRGTDADQKDASAKKASSVKKAGNTSTRKGSDDSRMGIL